MHYIPHYYCFPLLMHSGKDQSLMYVVAVSSSFEAGTLRRRPFAWSKRRTFLTPTGGINCVCNSTQVFLGFVRESWTICWRWATVVNFGRPFFGRVERSPTSSSLLIHLATVVRRITSFHWFNLWTPLRCMPINFPIRTKEIPSLVLFHCQTY